MLSLSERSALEEKLRRFEEETSNQVVVVTFPSLEGESLEDFSIRLAGVWKIGQKGKDNGVILLIFKKDRKVRIEVGYGLEGALPDATSKLIIENEIVPRFRKGRFEEGIQAAVQAIMAATRGEYQSERRFSSLHIGSLGYVLLAGFVMGLLLPFGFLLALFIVSSFIETGALVVDSKNVFIHALALAGMISLPTYLILRHGRKGEVLSRHGSHRKSVSSRSGSWGGDFGGGGFGGGFGGGGGSFGGGGASGSW